MEVDLRVVEEVILADWMLVSLVVREGWEGK